MTSMQTFNFILSSIFIISGFICIYWGTIFIPKNESSFTKVLITMSKIFTVYFIISLNYRLFQGKISYTNIFFSICSTLCFIVIPLNFCKVIIFKHLVVYNFDILLKKNINELYIEDNKLIIKTNNKTLHIDINTELNEKLSQNLSYK